ncbi:MAG: hypothetical protein H0U60_12960 [Blastocatellia bacterium]|nr:hypothetical protein [Blastocatellia bacterium]
MAGDEYEKKKTEFLREAGEAFDRMMKEDQEQMITFDQMEDRALEVGGKLERWLVEKRLAEDARQKTEGSQGCCSQCRKPLQLAPTPKERRLRGRTGEISFQRQEGYCPSCRKAFFPSGSGVETGR